MKNNISKYTECANCGACYNICPTNSIKVLEENYFYELKVDSDKCIECGKCVSICPVNQQEVHQNIVCAIGGYNKNEALLKKSSSGAAFYALAEKCLSDGGIVFGAAFNEENDIVEIKSTDEVPLEYLLRSKYVESLPRDSFKKVKKELEASRKVLFCGCPCQVAGLKRFLGKEYEKLILCDFSCGGLPSHKIYADYLDFLKVRYNSRIRRVNFRAKLYGWSTYSIFVEFENKKEYKALAQLDPFFNCFISENNIVRENCVMCKFADNHYSDIVLADFWLHKSLSSLENNKGLSLVIANSEKGQKLIDEVLKSQFIYEDLDINKATYNMKKPYFMTEHLKQRNEFFKKYDEAGLKYLCSLTPKGFKKIKIVIKNILKQLLKKVVVNNVIKKILKFF